MRSRRTPAGSSAGVLRHQFAAERPGEDGLVEMADELAGAGRFGDDAIDPGEGIDKNLHTGAGTRRAEAGRKFH